MHEKANILLVDDQPAKLLSYEVILRELGENLITANSGREALEQLLKADIAVILADVCMPDLDGFELAQLVREHPRFRHTAIIFVSAVATEEFDRLRGYESGGVDYVPVPVVPEVLRAKVRVFAELHRKTRQLERLNAELEQRVVQRTEELARANAELERRVEERTREREAALAKLHGAQKMESLGQLTGGVAHDFNNLLTAVLGSLELIARHAGDATRVERLAQAALAAGRRGAEMTGNLLAFARKQVLRPETVRPNRLLQEFEPLLRRAVGETIEVTLELDPELPPAHVDPSQFQAAVLNLAVNARDAMPDGGTLRIETCRVVLGQQEVADLPEAIPGPYLRVTVADTGCGMDAATSARAFEPFFTTKAVGKGTGLGLSQIYGFAHQAGGHCRIRTAPGQGCAIELYLPPFPEASADAELADSPVPPRRANGEIVLVVEDEPAVREIAVETLQALGYEALSAPDALTALDRLRGPERIDILFSDVVMPGGMDGAQLAGEARKLRPGLKVVLASGYTALGNAEGTRDLPGDVPLLRKPYLQQDLADQLEEVLER